MAMRTVDVVVPSYNYGAYLEGCVQSLLSQEDVVVRVLVIDDASTDDTPQVGARLAAGDPRVTYRRHATNAGHIATYNEGLIGWANAEYVLLISADDLLVPGALRRAVAAFESHPSATLVHGRQIAFEHTPLVPEGADALQCGYTLQTGASFIESVCGEAQNPVATPTAVVRTSAQHAVGGYDPQLPHTADLEMWLRLATCGDVLSLEAPQAFKRHHGKNMQLAFLTNPEGDIAERRQAFASFFERFGSRVGDVTAGQRHVDMALADELFWRASRVFEAGDRKASARLFQQALSMYPPIAGTPHWRRMTLKRKFGPRTWAIIQKLTGRREQWA